MRKTLAVAARELQERWLLLAGGLALGFVPLVLPHLDVRLSRDAVAPVGLVVRHPARRLRRDPGRLVHVRARRGRRPSRLPARQAGLLARDLGGQVDRRWSARRRERSARRDPLDGRLSSRDRRRPGWRAMADPQGWTFAVSLVVLIVGFANFAATAFRARSKWLVVDLTLLLAALWAIRRLRGTARAMVGVRPAGRLGLRAAARATGASPSSAASAAQLAVGRTDLRPRAPRALDRVLGRRLLAARGGGRLAHLGQGSPVRPISISPCSSTPRATAAGCTSWAAPAAGAIPASCWTRRAGAISTWMSRSRGAACRPRPRLAVT